MGSVGHMLQDLQDVFWLRFLRPRPRAWSHAVSALCRSLALAIAAIMISRALHGTVLAIGLLGIILVAFVLPAYIHGRRTETFAKLSMTDPLTNIGNRRALMLRLREEMARCKRSRTPLAILMVDVDKLKKVNDSKGHKAGDAALCTVALALRRSTRVSDVVGRLGGDEFLVIAPETDERSAIALGERIANATHRESNHRIGMSSIDLSIGIATVAGPDTDIEELLETADRAVYEAKSRGGNRVVGQYKEMVSNVVPIRPTEGG